MLEVVVVVVAPVWIRRERNITKSIPGMLSWK
jgi:hypothetical protein